MNQSEPISRGSGQKAEGLELESPKPDPVLRPKQPRRPDGRLMARSQGEAIAVFWTRVNKRGPNECWEWQNKSLVGKGYGSVRVNKKGWRAHVFSWFIHNGPTNGLCVCHKCDNPRCVNPAHLFLGTVLDNTRDMIAKGRQRKAHGQDCGNAKLTDDQVAEIRKRYKRHGGADDGVSLGREFGVSYNIIYGVVKRRIWKHVP